MARHAPTAAAKMTSINQVINAEYIPTDKPEGHGAPCPYSMPFKTITALTPPKPKELEIAIFISDSVFF